MGEVQFNSDGLTKLAHLCNLFPLSLSIIKFYCFSKKDNYDLLETIDMSLFAVMSFIVAWLFGFIDLWAFD